VCVAYWRGGGLTPPRPRRALKDSGGMPRLKDSGGVSKDSGEELFLRLSPLRGEHIFKDSLFQLAITLNVRFSSVYLDSEATSACGCAPCTSLNNA